MKKVMLSVLVLFAVSILATAGEPLKIGAMAVKTDVEMKNVDPQSVIPSVVEGSPA
jgi:hypothetical protein